MSEPSANKKHIVVVGGGTGTHTILRGLKQYHEEFDLTAVVTMADSGGSTGRLRDEFGHLPVGDARMALAALAADTNTHDELVRQLFLYRFSKGNGLSGHNFGNLLLTALTELCGSEAAAIESAARILRVRGSVLPVTAQSAHLQATYDDGLVREGEVEIDEPPIERAPHRIVSLALTPAVTVNPKVVSALQQADLIVFGPGDLYTSILANCVVDGFGAAVKASEAPTVFVANLMTKAGQTTGMSVADHAAAIAQCSETPLRYVLCNTAPLPADLLERYATEQEYPVADAGELPDTVTRVEADLLSEEPVVTAAGDVVKRSLIRHDSDKLAAVVRSLAVD